jgi:hypothetical protein
MKEQACIKVDETDNLTLLPLSVAEKDGTLFPVGSVYVAQDGMIRDSLQYAGPRVVTFANILKYDLFPLNDIINEFLRIGSLGMGSPVEIEFAVNIDEDESKGIDFYFLQIRPMVTHQEEMAISFDNIEEEHILCSTEQSLGNGLISDIEDIILVNPDYFELALTRSIATEVGYFNDKMLKEGRKYLLIGPGRWGSSDPWLGIPVNWSQISGVGVIVETKLDKLNVDPSQGTHFFHNIVSLGVGYLTVMTDSIGEFLNWPLLQKLTPTEEKRFLTHYRLDHPLDVRIHGKTGKAMIMIDED